MHNHHSHHLLHHSRVQSLDLMDDIPLPFQTDPHHLSLLNQDSPMLSPNPPPSVIDSNTQNLLQTNITVQANQQTNLPLNTAVTSSVVGNMTLNSNNQNNNNLSSTNSTNLIQINNIKTATTTLGKINPDSGIVHQLSTCDETTIGADIDNINKTKKKDASKSHWSKCSELHKAMEGVNYIADHTKREEVSEKRRGKNINVIKIYEYSCCLYSTYYL